MSDAVALLVVEAKMAAWLDKCAAESFGWQSIFAVSLREAAEVVEDEYAEQEERK